MDLYQTILWPPGSTFDILVTYNGHQGNFPQNSGRCRLWIPQQRPLTIIPGILVGKYNLGATTNRGISVCSWWQYFGTWNPGRRFLVMLHLCGLFWWLKTQGKLIKFRDMVNIERFSCWNGVSSVLILWVEPWEINSILDEMMRCEVRGRRSVGTGNGL